ncbi:MAG: YIP1 family protein [Chloroflexi bacterium]|nr:YIP1 family protein [Chloroflexota bacterium]
MLAQLFQSWATVLTQPAVATFDRERPAASLDKVLVAILLAGLVAGVGSALGQLVLLLFLPGLVTDGERAFDPLFAEQMAPTAVGIVVGVIVAPLAALIGFFVWAGVLFLVAKVLGGPGDFVAHSYLLSLSAAPLTAINGVLSIIPCLALLAAIPVFIYQLVLTTLALQSAHRFTVGRAIAVWLIPVAVLFFLGLCFAVLIFALVIAALGGG